MNRIVAEQVRLNRMTRGNWELAGAHRARVTELLAGGRTVPAARLCVLGAGNCNDLDLPRLLNAFSEIHLVDLDPEALIEGVKRQGMTGPGRLHLHAAIDVTGVAGLMALWSPENPPTDRELGFCIEHAAEAPAPELAGPFDVVGSTCLLTQLIHAAIGAVGETHPRLLDLIMAIRQRHLLLMAELLAAGGTGVLVSDIVSTDTAPALADAAETQLPELVARLINERNFFTGANPAVLHRLFVTDPRIQPLVTDVQLSRPWLWRLGSRSYAVCSLTVRRRYNGRAS